MKVAIPLGLLLLIGIVPWIQRAPSRPAMPERRGPVNREAMPQTVREEETSVPPVAHPSPAPSGVRVTVLAVPAWKKPFGILDQALPLTAVQKPAVEQILQDRETEIRSFHEAIRKAGFVDLRHYEWQVELMKTSWYRKLDALLDAPQHEALIPLIEKGLLNEGLAFMVEPGMTILD